MITIKDIAELAGVSKSTVSRALNNNGYVAPETKKKIDEIIKANNYLPSATAVNLSKQESMAIGVVVPEIGNIFYADIVHGITEVTDTLDLSVVLFDTQNSLEKEVKAFHNLQQQRVKGIILGPSVDYNQTKEGRKFLSTLRGMSAPIVVVDRDFDNMVWDAVISENYQSSYQTALAFYQAGNRKMAVITGDMNLKIARDRFAGFRDGLEECGLELAKEDVLFGDFYTEKAYELSKELFKRGNLPDAVFCCNNRTSLGFLKAARECGIRTGEDIAVIGKDWIESVDIFDSSFSCIYSDNYEMGREAVRVLQKRIEQPGAPRSVSLIPYELRLNGSEKKKKK